MNRILTFLLFLILSGQTIYAQEKTGNHKMNSETSKTKSASKYYERGSSIKEVKELTDLGSNEKYYISRYDKGYVYSEIKKAAKYSTPATYNFYYVATAGNRIDKPKSFSLNAPAGVKPVAVSFSNDGNTMFATCLRNGSVSNFTIYEASKTKGSWTGWKELDMAKTFVSAGFPVVNSGNNTLYFCAKSKVNKSGYDIYTSVYNDGWQKASALQGDINSEGDDMYPTLYGDVLFYSSTAKGGEGSSDIILVDLKDAKRECFNVGSEINTKSAEKMLILNADNKTGVMISNKNQANKQQIFSFEAEHVFVK